MPHVIEISVASDKIHIIIVGDSSGMLLLPLLGVDYMTGLVMAGQFTHSLFPVTLLFSNDKTLPLRQIHTHKRRTSPDANPGFALYRPSIVANMIYTVGAIGSSPWTG